MSYEKKKGFGHLVIGATDTGKTSLVKSHLSRVHPSALEIFDINREYLEYYPKPFLKHSEFMERVAPMENKVIVFEEAGIFFELHGTDELLKEMLIRKSHTGNYIFMNFHSLRMVPRYVFDLSNYLTLFETMDNETYVKNKIPNDTVLQTFKDVRDDKNLTHYKVPGIPFTAKFKTVKIHGKPDAKIELPTK
jgi:hypothetical protein